MSKNNKYGLIIGILLCLSFIPVLTHAAITNWQKAASLNPRWSEDFASESFKTSLNDLKAANANTASFIVPYYTSNCQSSNVIAAHNTPTDASLIAGIAYAKSIGLQINLKPHLEALDNWGGTCSWRANINPSDRDTFFTNYNNLLKKLAAMGPNEMTIGAELIRLSSHNINPDNTTRWKAMIAGLRTSYPGVKLNYSANWGSGDFATETNQVKFWDVLDNIGVSGYYEHWTPTNPANVEEIKASWNNWNNSNIKPLNTTYGKPVVFTEIGYKSNTDARQQPWNYDKNWQYNATEQVNLYEALFQYWNGQNFFNGINIWHWETDPNGGGTGNTDYTPQNKPAEAVITKYFAGGTLPTPTPTPPTPTPPPSGTPNYSSSGSVTPTSPVVNQPVTLNVSLTNSGQAVSNTIVDIEVYNSADAKVFQKFFEGENFTAGQTRNFSTPFTPTSTGTYTLKVGVFNSNWSTNYHWSDVLNFNVGSTPTPTPTPPTPTPPPPTCTGTGTNSFTACYYDSMDLTNLKLVRNEASINNDWAEGSPSSEISVDTYSAQWQGNFNFDAATYNFTVTADDGIRVYLDNALILDKWIDQSATTYNFARPVSAGTHQVKVQYFENTGNAVAKVSWAKQVTPTPTPPPTPTPTPTPTPPPPAPATLEIWWPTNGSTISGVQPFQAVMTNMNLSDYSIFWQVDGDSLNPMANETSGAPHKRAWVDVSGWTWNSSKSYKINFVARNLSGTIIAQKEITIYVAN